MNSEIILSRSFLESHPFDAARVLENLNPAEVAELLQKFPPKSVAAPVLQLMDIVSASECLSKWSDENSEGVLSFLPLHYTARLLRRMEEENRNRLLKQVSEEKLKSIRTLLRFPDNTAGALMDPRILALPEDISIGEAQKRIQRKLRDTFYYIFIVSRDDRLVGVIDLRELMFADRKQSLSSAMHRSVERISARAKQEAILSHPGWRRLHTLPVVDDKETFLGVIRYQTMREIEKSSKRKYWNCFRPYVV
ncbi:magnesium transporter MgtE N-terminal domain-containing protein [Gemmatimonadota bacterium]